MCARQCSKIYYCIVQSSQSSLEFINLYTCRLYLQTERTVVDFARTRSHDSPYNRYHTSRRDSPRKDVLPLWRKYHLRLRVGKRDCFVSRATIDTGLSIWVIYRRDGKKGSCARNYGNNIARCIYSTRNNIVMVCVSNISRLTACDR